MGGARGWPVIRARDLAKVRDTTPVLVDVTFDVAPGEGLAIAGAEDAGRSTLLRILATLERPTSGSVQIDGVDAAAHVFEVRRRIGYPDRGCVTGAGLRVAEHLDLIVRTRTPRERQPAARVRECLERVGLSGMASVDSLGLEHRAVLALAATLIGRPDVLLLDEPLAGIGAPARKAVISWMSEMRLAGCALVVASREDDVHALCQRTIRLESGRMVACAG